MDFLSQIIASKSRRVLDAKRSVSRDEIVTQARLVRSAAKDYSFSKALRASSKVNVIAEFKRRSPSKGDISRGARAADVARQYESAGAAAISVLTEEDYFAGSLDDLRAIRAALSIPILRKDFVIDEFQVYEAAAAGADAVLLIVAALSDAQLRTLRELIEDELRMDALVEIHTREELDRAISCGARTIGINNRDLHTFNVSTNVSAELARFAPTDTLLISESGLTPDEVRRLRGIGFNAFLIGESLMRAHDPAQALREFFDHNNPIRSPVQVKICGITNIEDALAAAEAGADLLGLNFYEKSPRFIDMNFAREVINKLRSSESDPKVVGVFVNAPVGVVVEAAEDLKLNGVQLHGDEPPDFCDQLRRLVPSLFQIKAFAANSELSLTGLARYSADAIMLDAEDASLRGGTGKLADWTVAREVMQKLPRVFLAGGLSPENIEAAIETVRPYGVDACSSLESAPGKKDAERMKRFVAAVHAVNQRDSGGN